MSKLTSAVLGKKIFCNPPVLAKVESAERMIAEGMLNDDEVRKLIDYDNAFIKSYDAVLQGAVDRAGSEQ